jgi:hypothetical protein
MVARAPWQEKRATAWRDQSRGGLSSIISVDTISMPKPASPT